MAEQLFDNIGASNVAEQNVVPQDSGSNIMDLNSLYSPSPSISNDINLEIHPSLSQFNLTPDSGLGNNIKVTNQYNDTPKLNYIDQLKWDGENPYADINKYQDPYKIASPYKFDAEKTNLDRYMAYGQSTFNRIGFNPTANNEERFNQETNIFIWKNSSTGKGAGVGNPRETNRPSRKVLNTEFEDVPILHDKCGTPDCCGKCETATVEPVKSALSSVG